MRVLLTADLHYNHPRSAQPAAEVIARMNAAGGDVLVVAGDTAVADGDALEQCLSLFRFAGPKLFLCGNHELWTAGPDSYRLFNDDLPRRVRALGWRWLEDEPLTVGDHAAIVGSVGWYDYAFARAELGIPRRFYAMKTSPGAAERLGGAGADLSDVPPAAREIVARWNDGRFVKLGMSDDAFLDDRLAALRRSLDAVRDVPRVIAAVHHVPFAALLPPAGGAQWDFAKAYLGSPRLGDLLLRYPNVIHAYCGHSHFPARARVGHVDAINIGSGYRAKRFEVLDV